MYSDQDDPIIKNLSKHVPGMFKDAASMPKELRDHVEISRDLLRIQGDIFSTYHMSDPGVFYNREDACSRSGDLAHGKVRADNAVLCCYDDPRRDERRVCPHTSLLTTHDPTRHNRAITW